MDGLISIIVPVYKAEKYIERCVSSIVNQSYKNIEILLIDDDSPDNCPALCDEWAERDERIRVIHKENTGVSDARQCGVAASNGEYILFVDSDDWIKADTCEYLLSLINSGDYQVACCSYSLTTDDSEPEDKKEEKLTVLNFTDTIKEVSTYSLWSIWAKLFRKSLFDSTELPHIDLIASEDLLTNFYLFRQCSNIIVSNKEKYLYYRHPDSVIARLSTRRIKDQLTAYETICNELDEGTPEHYYSMANRLLNDFQLLNNAFYVGYDKNFIKPAIDDIKKCRKYVFAKETDYCINLKYKLSTIMLMISPELYKLAIKLSGKKY